jgi:PadR family transcriptional regulator PadR
MGETQRLGEFEQLVLLAVLRLGADAHGIEIRRVLQDEGGRSVARGALYKTLERLADKELITWTVSDSTPERGGLPRRRFEVTGKGIEALRESKRTLVRFWAGLEKTLG